MRWDESQRKREDDRKISDLANHLFFGTICRTAPIKEESQPSYYRVFVDKLLRRPGAHCVISFNYDLLLDFQLAWLWKSRDGKLPVDELQWTYGINFNHRMEWDWCEGLPQEAKISYYKLHGSLNMSFDPETKAVSLHGPCGDHQAHRYVGREEQAGQPLLIPPLLQKKIPIPALAALWEKAEEKLSQAEEIHVIGYSAPDADQEARKLLKGVGKRKSIKRVVIVNKKPDDRDGLQILLKASTVKVQSYELFEEYLSSEYGAELAPAKTGILESRV